MTLSPALLKLINQPSKVKVIFLFYFLILATTYPKYLELLRDPSPGETHAYFFQKIAHPLRMQTKVKDDTHGSKITFRLTVPLLAKSLGIGSQTSGKDIIFLYIIQSLLLIPFLLLLIELVCRFTTYTNALIFTAGCCFTYLCKAFFWDYDFWFDAYAYFFLVAGLYFRKPLPVLVCLSLACWTDERALIALPGVLIFQLIQEADYSIPRRFSELRKLLLRPAVVSVFLTGIMYLSLRFFASQHYNLVTPTGSEAGVSLSMLPFQLKNRLIGIFLIFEGLWLIPIMCFYLLFRKHHLFFLLLGIALLIQILVAYCVFDISRSLGYSFPILLVCFALLSRSNPSQTRQLLVPGSLACLFIPTQFLIYFPRQIPATVFSLDELATTFLPFVARFIH